MAASGYTPISLYYSTTASAVPTSGNLANGELGLNIADMKLYAKNSAGTVTLLASSGGAAGTVSSVAATVPSFLSIAGSPITTSGTLAISLSGTALPTTSGGTGLTSFTSGGVVYASSSSALATGSALLFNGTDLGLGVTPSVNTVSGSGYRQIEVGTTAGNMIFAGGNEMLVSQNVIYNSGWKYAVSTLATQYRQNGGKHEFYTAPAGTAGGVVTFTQAMTLDASNRLLIGSTVAPTSSQIKLLVNSSSGNGGIQMNYGAGTGGAALVPNNGAGLIFYTYTGALGSESYTAAMTLDSSANLGIGTTTPNSYSKLQIAGGGSGAIGALRFSDLGLTNYWDIGRDNGIGGTFTFTINGSEKARFSIAGGYSVGTTADPGAGAIYATGNITAYYSDARLKTVSGKIENALDKVGKLSGVYYTNNDTAKSFGYDSDEVQVGVLAQDVEAVLPQIVKAAPFDLDADGNSKSGENYKTVQYERLVPLLIEAINELQAKVKALESK